MEKQIALVGNPNTGKTTFLNSATGANFHVGNWHGVTIDPVAYSIKGTTLIDLAGTYSLSPYTLEERITDNFVLQNKTQIFNICEQNNLKRNLMLTLQLLELNCNVTLVVNNFGEKANFDKTKLAQLLNCPVHLIDFFDKKSVLNLFEKQNKEYINNKPTLNLDYLNKVPFNEICQILKNYTVDFTKLYSSKANKNVAHNKSMQKRKSNKKFLIFSINLSKKRKKQSNYKSNNRANYKFDSVTPKNKSANCKNCPNSFHCKTANNAIGVELKKQDKSFWDAFVALRIIEGDEFYITLYNLDKPALDKIKNLLNNCPANIYSLRFEFIENLLQKCNYSLQTEFSLYDKNSKISNNIDFYKQNNQNCNNNAQNSNNNAQNSSKDTQNSNKDAQNGGKDAQNGGKDAQNDSKNANNTQNDIKNTQNVINFSPIMDKKLEKSILDGQKANCNGANIAYLKGYKLDKILLNKYLAIPLFLLIILFIFYITFGSVGAFFSGVLEYIIVDIIGTPILSLLQGLGVDFIYSLFKDGILGGVGSIASFLPQVLLLFLFLTILEESGYMSRLAYLLEGICNKVGLSGKSVFTFLMGYGCTATAILTAENLESKNAKIKTVLTTPFMACSAKLPVFAVLGGAFFGAGNVLVIFLLYILSAVIGIVVVNILDKTILPNNESSFLLEFPPYRVPKARVVAKSVGKNAKQFIKRVASYILIFSVLIWFLQSFTFTFSYIGGTQQKSILQTVSEFIAPVFAPLGFGEWGAVSALFAGLIAKELIVSSIGIINNVGAGDVELVGVSLLATSSAVHFSTAGVLSFLTFVLLYTPCVATISAMRYQVGAKWTAFSVALQLVVAYIGAFVVYNLACLFV